MKKIISVLKKVWILLLFAVIPILFYRNAAQGQFISVSYSGDITDEVVFYFSDTAGKNYSGGNMQNGSILPGIAITRVYTKFPALTRIDFGSGKNEFSLNNISFYNGIFNCAVLTPEQIINHYRANSYVSWKYAHDRLTVKTTGNDPFIVPVDDFAGKLTYHRSYFTPPVLFLGMILTIYYLLLAFLFLRPLKQAFHWFCEKLFIPYKYCWCLTGFLILSRLAFPPAIKISDKEIPQVVFAGIFILFAAALKLIEFIAKKRTAALELKPASPKKKRPMDMSMVYFRATAIIFIVIGHYVINFRKLSMTTLEKNTLLGFYANDSVYFLFISGYLFYYLTDRFTVEWNNFKPQKISGKFNLLMFYRKKLQNLLCPYLIISVVIAYFIHYSGITVGSHSNFVIEKLPEMLLKGTVQFQYWYIPYILIIFVFIPIFLLLPHWLFRMILIPAVCCSLGAIRPVADQMLSFNGFTFFFSSFLLGMWYAMDKDIILPFLKKYFYSFVAVAIILLIMYDINPSGSHLCPLTLLHKWSMTAVIIVLLQKLESKKIPFLEAIANHSFTLYFLHIIVAMLYVSQGIENFISICGLRDMPLITTFGSLLMFIFLLAYTLCLKTLLGKYSRYIIGS